MSSEVKQYWPEEIVGTGELVVYAEDYAALEAECERLRMQLAACGVVALANTPESAAQARQMHPDYMSASCSDVADAVDREMALRQQRDALATELAAIKGQGEVVEVVGYMRKWAFDKEVPQKEKNANGRWAWPKKFILNEITIGKCLSDDVALMTVAQHNRIVAALNKVSDETHAQMQEAFDERDVALSAKQSAQNSNGDEK